VSHCLTHSLCLSVCLSACPNVTSIPPVSLPHYLTHPPVLAYFATLGASMAHCFRGCSRRWTAAALLSMGVTWAFIIRWTVRYKVSE
jgi:hypothetical protein